MRSVFYGPSERDTHGPFGTDFKVLNWYEIFSFSDNLLDAMNSIEAIERVQDIFPGKRG